MALPLGKLKRLVKRLYKCKCVITVLLALDGWLRNDVKSFILFSGASIIIFRAELALFLGILLLHDLYYQRVTVKR